MNKLKNIDTEGTDFYKKILIDKAALEEMKKESAGSNSICYIYSNSSKQIHGATSFIRILPYQEKNRDVGKVNLPDLQKTTIMAPSLIYFGSGETIFIEETFVNQTTPNYPAAEEMFRQALSSFEELNGKRQQTLGRRQKLASYEDIYDKDL